MTYNEIKDLVGVASNLTICSDSMRYSELYALAQRAGVMQSGTLTIVVKINTLTPSELKSLVHVGNGYVSLNLANV